MAHLASDLLGHKVDCQGLAQMKLDREQLHLVNQPLNVVRLATGNMLNRIKNDKSVEDKEYFITKIEIIEAQIDRLSKIFEEI